MKAEFRQIEETTHLRYLSGKGALNLIARNGTGDWHFFETFKNQNSRSFIAGEGCVTNTNDLFGSIGIFECSAKFVERGLTFRGKTAYAATHARAIADMLLETIRRDCIPNHIHLDDWMPRPSDKQEVFDLLALAYPKLTITQQAILSRWQEMNCQDEYEY